MLGVEQASDVAFDLLKVRNVEYRALSEVAAFAAGRGGDLYIPRDARQEFRWIAQQAKVNLIPKVIQTHVSSLYVDGYKSPEMIDNLPAWQQWQANRMDARQTGVHKAALEFGTSYVRVLPGDTGPAWAPFSPMDMTAVYADPVNDEWPEYALTVKRQGKGVRVELLAPSFLYVFVGKDVDSRPEFVEVRQHPVPWTPVVKFQSEYTLDGVPTGMVAQLMELQNQINLTTFNGMVAQVYASFKQKWVTGFEVPKDEEGRPIEPFKAAVNRLWIAEGEASKFGQFDSEDLQGYLAFREDTIRALSTVGHVPPHTVLGALANLSAESLAAAEVSKTRFEDMLRLLFGESWEQTFRLSRFVAGERDAVEDGMAEVVWRDTEARSQAQITDAAVKLRSIGFPMTYIAEMLGRSPQEIPQLLADIEAEQTAKAKAEARSFGVITDETEGVM